MDIDWDKATKEQHIKNLDDYANGDSYQRSVEWAVDEIKSLKADAERWRYFIETASGEAAFELTSVTDTSNG